jgi:predicted phage tail protein
VRRKVVVGGCVVLCLSVVAFVYRHAADARVAERKEEEARAKFAFQSLENRIPRGKPIPVRFTYTLRLVTADPRQHAAKSSDCPPMSL